MAGDILLCRFNGQLDTEAVLRFTELAVQQAPQFDVTMFDPFVIQKPRNDSTLGLIADSGLLTVHSVVTARLNEDRQFRDTKSPHFVFERLASLVVQGSITLPSLSMTDPNTRVKIHGTKTNNGVYYALEAKCSFS